MRKHNQIHALGAPHYKAHTRFLWKLQDFSSSCGPKNTVKWQKNAVLFATHVVIS